MRYEFSLEVGYAVTVTSNPKKLDEKKVELLLEALADFDDVPNQDNLYNFLNDVVPNDRELLEDFSDEDIEKARAIEIQYEVAYRDVSRI